jgi:uncharacterized DUF497 family protein
MFEWNEAKRLANLERHHLDFRDAAKIFDGRPALHVPAIFKDEARFASIAVIGAKFYTVIWTWRGVNRRIISFRRSRDGEEKAHRKAHS